MSKTIHLYDFYADWCGPCKMMEPVFESLQNDDTLDIELTKIDVENPNNQNAVGSYGIQSIPTLLFFTDEQDFENRNSPDDVLMGAVQKEKIVQKVKQLQN